LKEWCGKTDESQWTTLRRLPHVWSNEKCRRGRFSSDEEDTGAGQNLLKTLPKKKKKKKLFLAELKITCETLEPAR
jgi:hypothetical protein